MTEGSFFERYMTLFSSSGFLLGQYTVHWTGEPWFRQSPGHYYSFIMQVIVLGVVTLATLVVAASIPSFNEYRNKTISQESKNLVRIYDLQPIHNFGGCALGIH